jgi:phthalate 4,5-cis-dihydrodiol dehydrogenase
MDAGATDTRYYNAYFEFEDGTVASIVHNGYGYFLLGDVNGPATGRSALETRVSIRKAMQSGTRDEASDKQDMRIGGPVESRQFQGAMYAVRTGGTGGRPQREPGDVTGLNDTGDPGTLIVSCERGDMRVGPTGVLLYDGDGVREVKGISNVNARGEVHEMYNAVVNGRPVFHSGGWGMATAEAIFGMIESSKQGREIRLTHQVPVHPEYDADLEVAPG